VPAAWFWCWPGRWWPAVWRLPDVWFCHCCPAGPLRVGQGDLGLSDRVDHLVTLDHQNPVTRHLDRVVRQGLQKSRRFVIGGEHGFGQRLDTAVGFADCDAFDLVSCQGMNLGREQQGGDG